MNNHIDILDGNDRLVVILRENPRTLEQMVVLARLRVSTFEVLDSVPLTLDVARTLGESLLVAAAR